MTIKNTTNHEYKGVTFEIVEFDASGLTFFQVIRNGHMITASFFRDQEKALRTAKSMITSGKYLRTGRQ